MKFRLRYLLLSIVIAAFNISAIYGQGSKISRTLKEQLSLTHKSEERATVFVKGDIKKIKEMTQTAGGTYKYGFNKIAAVEIPLSQVEKFARQNFIQRIEGDQVRGEVLNDQMVINNNVVPVHQGLAPLDTMYDGEGIIIGFIDTGIDIDHPDFKNSDGTTRIKYIWDQIEPCNGTSPQPYNYGIEWTSADIDSGICTHLDESACFGHGTHVAGIAAGNGLAVGNFKGVAPKADIIMVASPFISGCVSTNANTCSMVPVGWMTTIADGVDYIFKKADAMGKPCVVNASVGTYDVTSAYGSRDGKDPVAQIIDGLVKAKDGRVFVAAAGNNGGDIHHLGYDVTSDTLFTWFFFKAGNCGGCIFDTCRGGGDNITFYVWADTSNFNNVQFSIGADKVSPDYLFRGKIPFDNILNRLNKSVKDTLLSLDSNRLGIIETYAEIVNNVTYLMKVSINLDSSQYYYRFSTTGSGRFDIWSNPCYTLTSKIAGGGKIPTVLEFPDIVNYKVKDSLSSVFSSFISSESTITVGNYINKNQYLDVNSVLQILNDETPGALSFDSSIGPTRDGRIKPDITATGRVVFSCGESTLTSYLIGVEPEKVAQGGMHIRNNGTSMSAPVVAGVAALYLQRVLAEDGREADYKEVKDAIINSAKQDSFTTSSLPNNEWGYGKVDAFEALKTFIPDTPVSFTNSEPIENIQWMIYPNPFKDQTTIHYAINKNIFKSAVILITDIVGQTMAEIPINKPSGWTHFKNDNITSGIYFCTFVLNDQVLSMEKMIIY